MRTNYGDRSFAVQGPRVWNSLPAELQAPDIMHNAGHVLQQTEDVTFQCVLITFAALCDLYLIIIIIIIIIIIK